MVYRKILFQIAKISEKLECESGIKRVGKLYYLKKNSK